MSRENVKNFYEMLKVDANLAQELMKLKEELEKGDKKFLNDEYVINEKIIPLAKKHGFDFTVDEFTAYSKEQLSKLSEEELLNVTGGTGVIGAVGGALLSIFSMFGFGATSTTSIPDTVIEGTTSAASGNTAEKNKEDSSASFKEINSSINNVNKKLVPEFKSKLKNNKTENIEYKSGDFFKYFRDDYIETLNESNELQKKEISDLQKQIQLLKTFSTESDIELTSYLKERDEKISKLTQDLKSTEKKLAEKGEKNERLNKEVQELNKEINKLKEEKNELLNTILRYHDAQVSIEKNMSEHLREIENENEGNRKALNDMKEKINDYDKGKKQLEENLIKLTKDREEFNKEKEEFNKSKEKSKYTSFTSNKLDEQASHLIKFLKDRNFNLDITNQALMKDIKHVLGQLWKDSKGTVYMHSKGVGYGILGTDYYASDVGVDQEELDALYNLKI